jgi:hypothetical protein
MPQSIIILDQYGNPVDSLKVEIAMAKGKIPFDHQASLQKTVTTHSASPILPSAWGAGNGWFDTEGWSEVHFVILSDSGTASNTVAVEWSQDGITKHGGESLLSAGATKERAGGLPTRQRWCRLSILNGDAGASHTFTAFAYLKA